jgi:hypothetical protein
MPKTNDPHQEGRIFLAINTLKTNQITSIIAAARAFDVPRITLYDRYHGRVQQFTIYTKYFKLTQLEEESLIK